MCEKEAGCLTAKRDSRNAPDLNGGTTRRKNGVSVPLGAQLSVSHHRLMNQIAELCVKSAAVLDRGGGLGKSHVRAELRAVLQGSWREKKMRDEAGRG